jgi:hypothetical protein
MNGKTCNGCLYPETANGCETPGCDLSIWMTDTVREQRKRDQADAQERAAHSSDTQSVRRTGVVANLANESQPKARPARVPSGLLSLVATCRAGLG